MNDGTEEITWILEERNIKDLKENPANPRRLSKYSAAHLKTSLKKFGVCEPIVVTLEGMIIGGHQRCKVLKSMKKKSVPVYVPSRALSDKEIEELTIRLNKNVGEWDFDTLANAWDPTDLIEWGFTEEELEIDAAALDGNDTEEDDELLEPSTNPRTVKGDVYELGNHRLMCGDSTNDSDVDALLKGERPILMVTDPPYGVNYDPAWRDVAGKGCKAKGKVSNDNKIDWSQTWDLFPGSVAYIWCASWFLDEVAVSIKNCSFEIKSLLIWIKQHFALSRGDYHWQHEPCWYAIKKGHNHNWQGSRKESTIWEIANLNCFGKSKEEGEERTAHSTQKPIECMARPIRNNTEEGEGVYDPFVGSGTTLIAAEQLNRNAFCMEIDPAYCDIVVTRWLNYVRKQGKDIMPILNGEEIEWEI